MLIVSLLTFPAAESNMALPMYFLLKVILRRARFSSQFIETDCLGLTEQLVNRLVSSAAEPHLKALKELYLNFWRTYYLHFPRQHL